VIREAVRRARGWRGEGDSGFTIAVNFSARQFRQPHLVESLRQILAEAGFPPERFEVEITEGILLSDREVCLQTLDRLRALGVRICIDDFGTGYSSLNYLARMPVHTLKIDRSFVGEMENPRQAAVTSAIISLGLGLDLKVIAEGVETERQREELARSGCRLAQGFLFGRPVPADRFGIPEGEGEIRPSRLDSPDQK
jgi:EAL domain-containing protein (putative c-di-GMP-specific phosphodiesterase class I)